jgi:hypothetical protein
MGQRERDIWLGNPHVKIFWTPIEALELQGVSVTQRFADFPRSTMARTNIPK